MAKKIDPRVLVGDCLVELKKLPDNSIDSIVTDPPYELGFMGKRWDASGIAYNVALWREALRVLKPGGHLLAFGGTRTYHRMTCAIEDAGFEIRDSIHWLYGSGFPKSLDVSKAIDKAAGMLAHESVGFTVAGRTDKNLPNPIVKGYVPPAPATDAAKQWSGWGTALKPAHEPIVVARKPVVGTVAANVLEHGTGALNIDGTRIPADDNFGGGAKGASGFVNGYDGAGWTPGHALGRWPANLVLTHAADCADTCAHDCPVAELDRQSGGGASRFFTVTEWDPIADAPFRYVAKPSKKERNAGLDALPKVTGKANKPAKGTDSNTTASGSTLQFSNQNHHPTVKPVELMRWLVRLVTPPGGVVLDPFLGSGTTAVAATLEGFDWRGCEMTEEYLPIIDGRVKWAAAEKAKVKRAPKGKPAPAGQGTLPFESLAQG